MSQLIRGAVVALFILGTTIFIIIYGRGYRLDLKKKIVSSTGSLVLTSDPNGAQVFIDGKFTTATNSTLQLPPGDYEVRIVKESYIPWEKRLAIRGEVVSKAEAHLFPINPSLAPLTSTGVEKTIVSADGSRILFARGEEADTLAYWPEETATAGLWILELVDRPLGLNRDPKQIARSSPNRNWAEADFVWSPDGKQILALFKQKVDEAKKKSKEDNLTQARVYLLNADRLNTNPPNVSQTLTTILKKWNEEKIAKTKQQLLLFPKEIVSIITGYTQILTFSWDETKILYEATGSATLPLAVTPPLLGSNPTLEQREIMPKKIYVYDAKEDKNFFIMESKTKDLEESQEKGQALGLKLLAYNFPSWLQWYFTSRHLILPGDNHIAVMEYDGTNRATVYAGPFVANFVIPWPSGKKLIILTTLNPTVSEHPNLYLINLH